jgi:anti-sigma factor RsiW
MTGQQFDDEILMAFADGELDEAAAAEVERAMETDDDLAMRVALFMETRARAREAMAPMLDQPVPEALRRSIEDMVARHGGGDTQTAEVVAFRPAANDRRPSIARSRWIAPIAASTVAVLAGVAGYWLGSASPARQDAGLAVAGLSVNGLPAALDGTPSGDEIVLAGSDARFRAIATFEDGDGGLCREFEVDMPSQATLVSVACRQAGDWAVSFVVVADSGADGYAPASSLDALDAYLSAIGAGEPLDDDDEREALSAIR